MSALDDSSKSSRKQMELQAEFLIRSVEEIEATNRQFRSCGGKRKQLEVGPSIEYHGRPTVETLAQHESIDTNPSLLRSQRALADDLSSCVGIAGTAPTATPTTPSILDTDATERLREIQSNAELKIRRLLHRVSHLEEQLALAQADNERLKQATVLQPKRTDDDDSSTQQYMNKVLVQQRSLIQENAKLKRELLSTCATCRSNNGRTTTKEQPSPARRPTFQSSARHVLENLPKQQRNAVEQQKNSLQQRRAWSTTPQSWNPRNAAT